MNMRHVIDLLKRADLHDEAAAVGMVMQQRTELLEALKSISEESGPPIGRSFGQMNRIAVIAHEAINRAEAAE